MTYVALVNRDSGYVMDKSPAFVQAMLDNALHGHLADLRVVSGKEVDGALADLFGKRPGGVIVLGGDGTARTAAEYARRTEIPIIPLPGGTMNLLPRRLYGEGDPADCLRRALRGRPARLDVGAAGTRLFFLSGFFGIAPNIARAREAMRGVGSLDGLISGFVKARAALTTMKGHGLTYRLNGEEPMNAETLIVSLGSLDRVFNPSEPLEEREFEMIGIDFHGFGDLARLGVKALMQQWRDDPGVHVATGTEISMHLCEHDPCAVLDGEPVDLPVDVQVRYLRDALPVIVPYPE